MRTIGSIERILVVGIVGVIGAILTVAIKGAGDFDKAQQEKQQLLANAPKGTKPKDAKGGKETPSRDPKSGLTADQRRALAKTNEGKPADGAPPAGKTPDGATPAGKTPDAGSHGSPTPGTETGNPVRLGNESTLGGGSPTGGVSGAGPEGSGVLPDPIVPAPDKGKQGGGADDGGRGTGPKEPLTGNPLIDDLLKKQLDAVNGGTGDGKSGRADPNGGHARPTDKPDGDDAPVIIDDGVPSPDGSKSGANGATGRREADAAAAVYEYEVRSGDSLERIARALYGDGAEFKAILAANPKLGDKNTIRVGQKLLLPRAPTQGLDLVTKSQPASGLADGAPKKPESGRDGAHLADGAPSPTPPAAAPPAKSASGFQRIGSAKEHTVARGDTLMSIALEHYGTKAAWRLIYDANVSTIPDKDHIKIGLVLKLPQS